MLEYAPFCILNTRNPMSHQQANHSKFGNLFFWCLSLILVAVAVTGNWYFSHQVSTPIRAVGVIIILLVALGTWQRTKIGLVAWRLMKESRIEMRKVAWPTRQETLQSAAMVLVIVALLALILWAIDSVFALIISNVIL